MQITCKFHLKWYKKTQLTKQIDKPQNGKNYSQNVYITKDLNSENIKNSLIIKSRSQFFKWANNFSKLFIRDMTKEKTHEKVFNITREKEITVMVRCHSIQLSHSVLSDSLWPHWFQHARLPCPSPAPGAYSNSCPLSQWSHPTISSSVVPFFVYLLGKHPQTFLSDFSIRLDTHCTLIFMQLLLFITANSENPALQKIQGAV